MLTLPRPEHVLEFQIDGEPETYAIPYPAGLGLNYSRRLQALGAMDANAAAVALMDIMVDVLNEYAPGAADKLTAAALLVLMQEWNSKDDLGES